MIGTMFSYRCINLTVRNDDVYKTKFPPVCDSWTDGDKGCTRVVTSQKGCVREKTIPTKYSVRYDIYQPNNKKSEDINVIILNCT